MASYDEDFIDGGYVRMAVDEPQSLDEVVVDEVKYYTGWVASSMPLAEAEFDKLTKAYWYESLSNCTVMPRLDAQHVILVNCSSAFELYSDALAALQVKVESYLGSGTGGSSVSLSEAEKDSVFESLQEFCRYLPDLKDEHSGYYIDRSTQGVGVTIKKRGTLSLLVHQKGCLDYSYAVKAKHGGLVRLTGTAKFTSNIENSEYLELLLGWVEGK